MNPPRREPALRFAVVADRTGGMRQGIFTSVIPKLNALAPDLVLSVGDLVPGGGNKTRTALTKEWDELDGLVRQLEAPFFYVPGNHDVLGETQRQVWQERYGPTYYSFVYAGLLFVCLDTIEPRVGRVREEQLSWLEGVMKRHADAKWTFLFMHVPLWEDWKGWRRREVETPVWDRVEAILGDRRYTAFAGHFHRYVKHQRRERSLYTLSTTGGGSSLRGPEYGEFDQVAWVTVTDDGPVVANLDVGGIWGDDVRNEEKRRFEAQLLGEGALEPSPVYFEKGFREGTSTVRVRNDGDAPVEVELSTSAREPLGVAPAAARWVVKPGSSREQAFKVVARSPWAGDGAGVALNWRATSTVPGGENVELSGSAVLSVVRVISARRTHRPVRIDGRLDEWGALPIVVDVPRQILGQAAAWRGSEDNRFRVGLSYDRDRLYVAVEVWDDAVEASRQTRPWMQDGVEVRIDARPDPVRARSAGARDGSDFLLMALSPSESADEDWLYAPEWLELPKGTEVACIRTSTGHITELAVPREWLSKSSGDGDGLIRLNVAVDDRDRDGRSVSWWWPDWRTSEDLPGSGTIRLGN